MADEIRVRVRPQRDVERENAETAVEGAVWVALYTAQHAGDEEVADRLLEVKQLLIARRRC